jgi:hypothetical protein
LDVPAQAVGQPLELGWRLKLSTFAQSSLNLNELGDSDLERNRLNNKSLPGHGSICFFS